MYQLTWAVVLVPLAGAGLAYLPESPRRAGTVTILATATSLALSLLVLGMRLRHTGDGPYQALITFWTYQPTHNPGLGAVGTVLDFHPQMGVLVDGLSAAVMPMVALVSLLVQIHSVGYMRGDAAYRRFFALIALFTFFMLGLVASPNLFQTYFMWEGVGLCSYLLIGHWWHKPEAAAAAKKAFLVTRIGDIGLLLGIVINYAKFAPDVANRPPVPGQDVNDPFSFTLLADEWHRAHLGLVSGVGSRTLVIVAVLVLIGAIGKSAQLPLHTWLPDAMEGPTPISALIHAATMVAAGAYLVARTYPLFEEAPHVLTAVALLGGATALFGAVVACAHNDIKRIIAYSTISHLGLMFLALGVGAFGAAVFHLLSHAWFKALLFLAAGNVIRAYGTQDIREMGGIWQRMRTTSWSMLIGVCSAAGIVLFAGFWSKDAIVAGVLRNQFPNGGHVARLTQVVLVVVVVAVSLLGAVYPFRMFFTAFLGSPVRRRGFQPERVRESPASMRVPVVLLAVLSAVFGFVGIEGARVSFGRLVYAGSGPQDLGFGYTGAALGGSIALLGVGVAWVFWARPSAAALRLRARAAGFGRLAADGFRIDDAYAWAVRRLVLRPATYTERVDQGITDAVAEAAVEAVADTGAELRRLQTGRLQAYTLGAAAGVALFAAGVALAATGHLPGVGASR